MTTFTRDTEIFCDEGMLREDYQPESITAREEELSAYKTALQPVVNGAQPRNIFLYGKTGVGKTAVSRYLLDQLKRDTKQYDDIDLSVYWLNCTNLSSSYQVAVNLVNTIRPAENRISTTGYPQQRIFDILYEELDAIGGTILLVLDEIDHIGSNDEILYELPRALAQTDILNLQSRGSSVSVMTLDSVITSHRKSKIHSVKKTSTFHHMMVLNSKRFFIDVQLGRYTMMQLSTV